MSLLDRYRAVREGTVALARPLSAEDQMLQSMPDASPTKWHLAHTSWFFETFLLAPRDAGYRAFDARFAFLFNSYYEGIGPRIARASRGLLSRPSLDQVAAYRRHVDDAMARLLQRRDGDGGGEAMLVELGLQHEQQHQELILTDIKHALATNPMLPPYRAAPAPQRALPPPADSSFQRHEGGLVWIGHEGAGFAFDNEGPRHRCFLRPFAIADRPVTCGEYLRFMRDGGYQRPDLWLSDGWHERERQGWHAPLYWQERSGREGDWDVFTLAGLRPVDEHEVLAHVSYYEADAFARWRGMRLPTEAEWEHAATGIPVAGHFADTGLFHPGPARPGLYGDVWQWTQSPYTPYPGYRIPEGPIGEYNGKFMSNQMVLRGGSCFTPAGHVRPTYRNFFSPASRWQATGIRLAGDA